MIKLNFKKLHPQALVPPFATPGAACFDLAAVEAGVAAPGASLSVGTGLAFEIPEAHVMLVYSRSGQGFKHGVRLVNGTGVIDSDYRGEVRIGLRNDGEHPYEVRVGDRIAQAKIIPVPAVCFAEVEALSETRRAAGGFGSTG